jgi:hypothetical protein
VKQRGIDHIDGETGALPGVPALNEAIKVGGGLVLAVFVVGFVCVNSYLLRLGTSDFSLARPRFVATGLLFATVLSLLRLPRVARHEPWYPTAWWAKLSWFFLLAAFTVLFVGGFLLWFNDFDYVSSLQAAIVMVIVAELLGFMTRSLFDVRDVSDALIATPRALVGIGIFIAAFNFFIYPQVPAQLGGGEPRDVVLVLSDDSAASVQAAGLAMCADSVRTRPVELLYESDTHYVLRSDAAEHPDRVVVLDRSLALAVVTRGLPSC